MKKLLITLTLSWSVCFSQAIENECEYVITHRIQHYQKMQNRGIAFLVMGGLMTAGGIAMVSSADGETYYESNTQTGESGDPVGALGALLVMGGIGLTVPGAIFTIRGVGKKSHYRQEAKRLKCTLRLTAQPNNVALHLDF